MLKLGIDSQPDLQPSGLADVQDVSEVRFATDSPLERDVFEPYVPQRIRSRFRDSRPISHHSFTVSRAGTESSNPSPSSRESVSRRSLSSWVKNCDGPGGLDSFQGE